MKKKRLSPTRKKNRLNNDFDSGWKDVITLHFEKFLELLFPEIHKDIDFTKGVEFIDKDLLKITPDSNVGNRYVDELVKVFLKDGEPKLIGILIHLEVQGKPEMNFMERMFVYHYRIFERTRKKKMEIVSCAVFTDEDENFRPDEYRFSRWGFELKMKIPIVKLIDFKNVKELREKLEKTRNPIGMVIKAQLKSNEIKRKDPKTQFDAKWQLIYDCLRFGYSREVIKELLRFIDWIIRLPEEYEKELTIKLKNAKEEYKMPYIASFERIWKEEAFNEGIKKGEKIGEKIGEKRGVKIGEERGVKIGEERGKRNAYLKTAIWMLSEGYSESVIKQLTGLSLKQINSLKNTPVDSQTND